MTNRSQPYCQPKGNKTRYRITAAVAAVLLVAGAWLCLCLYQDKGTQSFDPDWPYHDLTSGEYSGGYDGIDISRHQGRIRWDELRGNRHLKFIYTKATEGLTLQDPSYSRNIQSARRCGILVGSYHFLTKSPGTLQARNFLRTIDPEQQDLLPVVDCEDDGTKGWSREDIQQALGSFIATCKDVLGVSPIIYCSESYYKDYLSPEFDDCILFIAKYDSTHPVLPGKPAYTIWQSRRHGRIPGIYNWVDLDELADSVTVESIRYHSMRK